MYYNNEKVKEFIKISRRAFLLGMQISSGGNISIRLNNELILTKTSGISLFDCNLNNLVAVNLNGQLIRGTGTPTKEINMHLGIYKKREDVNAVVHYHSPYSTSFASKGMTIPLNTLHSKRILKDIPIIPEAEEGSAELAELVTNKFENMDVKAVLLTGHGIVTIGPSLTAAENLAELVEESAKIAILKSQIN